MLVIVGIVVALAAPITWFVWLLIMRSAARGEFRPSLHGRVEVILGPHQGHRVSDEVLADLQGRVDEVVLDTLLELHRVDHGLAIIVRHDDVLGPVCLVRTSDGTELSLADFEARLRS
jgi:hypothetical protein